MPVKMESDQSQPSEVGELRAECERLREELAKTIEERDMFRTAFYETERKKREFEDVDFEELKKGSAGPFERV